MAVLTLLVITGIALLAIIAVNDPRGNIPTIGI